MSMPFVGPEDPQPPLESEAELSEPVQQPPFAPGGDDPTSVADGATGGELAMETEPAPEPEPLAPRTGWRLYSLIPHDGKEPAAGLPDDLAQACWCAVSALWHPSLLARAAELPRVQPVE